MPSHAPLTGYRILDLTNVLAGPFCSQQLAHLGAEVIKIEHPDGGDLARQLGAHEGLSREGLGTSFLAQNAGKQSTRIDLKSSSGRQQLLALVDEADALIENFRPGVMARLDLDYAMLSERNPGLVYCAISGFGQTGPLSDMPAYDQIIQGMSGLMSVTGSEQQAPLRAGFPVADTVGGLTAAFAVCSALAGRGRGRNSGGSMIDVSMLESMLSSMGWIVSNFLIAGHGPEPLGNDNATGAPSGTFQTGDGLINIAAAQQHNFEKLCLVLDAEWMLADERFGDRYQRLAYRDELTELIEDILGCAGAEEWQDQITAAGVPAGCVLSIEEILDHPQIQERKLLKQYPLDSAHMTHSTVCAPGFLIDGKRPVAND